MPSHVVGFLRSFKRACAGLFLNPEIESENTDWQAISFASIPLAVSSFETLLRDLFIDRLLADSESYERARDISNKSLREATSENNSPENSELLATQWNFQNLERTERLFVDVADFSVFDALTGSKKFFLLDSRNEIMAVEWVLPASEKVLQTALERLFSERHEIIHNAHYRSSLGPKEIVSLLKTAYLAGQLVCIEASMTFFDEETEETPSPQLNIEGPFSAVMYLLAMTTKGPEVLENQEFLELFEKHREEERALSDQGTPRESCYIGPYVHAFELLKKTEFENSPPSYSHQEVMHFVGIVDSDSYRVGTARKPNASKS